MSKPENLTVVQFCAEYQVARSTLYCWRAKGKGPRIFKLPNGKLRIRRGDIERWLAGREVAGS